MDDSNAAPAAPGATSFDSPPVGDLARQAVAALRGYTYQVAAAALAWLDLEENGRIYLEVAEDYAIAANDALNAVQVKDTSRSITLNTDEVRDAIAAFIQLTQRNPDKVVRLRYMTTSSVGTEQKLDDRPNGESGLTYWRKATDGADIGPIRAILDSDRFPDDVRSFVASRDDETLRRDLLQRIQWDAGQHELEGIVEEIAERLVVLGHEQFGLPAPEARRLADNLIYKVLHTSVQGDGNKRVLTRAMLYELIAQATRVSIPRHSLEQMLDLGKLTEAILGANQSTQPLTISETAWLTSSDEFVAPRGVVPRTALAKKVSQTLEAYGCVVLVGSSGLGKSLLAREVLQANGYASAILDLRDADVSEATRRLGIALGRLGTMTVNCLIFDDCNQLQDVQTRTALVRCLHGLRRRNRRSIVTTYRCPSQTELAALGLDVGAVIEVPYLSEEEVKEMVSLSGGTPETWGPLTLAASSHGHPQLAHAFVLGMAAREWQARNLEDLVTLTFASDDINAERDAARRAILAALPDAALDLLYRLSLVIGRFDRRLAIAIGEVEPRIERAGEQLDLLIGPWVETVSANTFRVSPLASNSGYKMLTDQTSQAIHSAIARQLLTKQTINAFDGNAILFHGLAGKEKLSLLRLAYTVVAAKPEIADLLRESLFMLSMFRTDTPIFPEDSMLSVMLRLGQFVLVSRGDDQDLTKECVGALMREVEALPESTARDALRYMALSKILTTPAIGTALDNWIVLLQLYHDLVARQPELQEYVRGVEKSLQQTEGLDGSYYGMLFLVGIHGITSIARLESVFNDLNRLTEEDRSTWLHAVHGTDEHVFVNSAWLAEDRIGTLDGADAAERYRRMATLASDWQMRALAIACYVARAVMLDEYVKDEGAALAALDEGVTQLGDDIAIQRARARIAWRHGKDHQSVEIMREVAEAIGVRNPFERAFALREAAISAARINAWSQAVEWFAEAEKAAVAAATEDMNVMAIGLEADKALALMLMGAVDDALRAMTSSLTRLKAVDPASSVRAGYCHRIIRQAAKWLESQVRNLGSPPASAELNIAPGTCSNPDPSPSVTELPLSSIDIAWYVIAEAEISSGFDVGIYTSLRANLGDRPLIPMEVALRHRRIEHALTTVDSAAFAESLLEYIAGMDYMRERRHTLGEDDSVLRSERGEIPPLVPDRLESDSVIGVAEDALMAFAMAAAIRGKYDACSQLEEALQSTIGQNFPGERILNCLAGIDAAIEPLDKEVLSTISRMRSADYLTPKDIWYAGLRLFEKVQRSGFRTALLSLLARWMTDQWMRIITEEKIGLKRPLQTVPMIEEVLTGDSSGESRIAQLLLAGAEAVGALLGAEYEKHLRSTAHAHTERNC